MVRVLYCLWNKCFWSINIWDVVQRMKEIEQTNHTHNAPARNRSTIIDIVLMANADENEKMKLPIAATRNTFCRPHVSAKKPNRWEVHTMPKYEIALKIPCSWVDKFRSHFAYGKMKLIFVFSIADPNTLTPVRSVSMVWYLPISENNQISSIIFLSSGECVEFSLVSSMASSSVNVSAELFVLLVSTSAPKISP